MLCSEVDSQSRCNVLLGMAFCWETLVLPEAAPARLGDERGHVRRPECSNASGPSVRNGDNKPLDQGLPHDQPLNEASP